MPGCLSCVHTCLTACAHLVIQVLSAQEPQLASYLVDVEGPGLGGQQGPGGWLPVPVLTQVRGRGV
jgi:hypothetical protein